MRKFLFLLTILQFCVCMQKINFDQALESLIEAERSFAKASEEKGIRDAFLIFLDDSAIVFRPKPIKAKPLYAQRQQIPGSLSWKPIYADISLAGDMGYTTGPFEYRGRSEQDSADGCGFYVSVWQKQNDDSWQVMIDAGINCPCPDTAIAEVIINQQRLRFANTTIPEVDVETEKSKLLKAEFEFAGSAALKGIVNAYQVYLADDIRYYRMGELPVVGKENVCSKVNKKSGTMFWKPMASDVAFSGDLGYTYGIAQLKLDSGEIKSNSYLRIWKKNRNMTWKIVLDLANPIPPDIEKPQS